MILQGEAHTTNLEGIIRIMEARMERKPSPELLRDLLVMRHMSSLEGRILELEERLRDED